MTIITVIAEQASPEALSTALPAHGIVSVTVNETQSFSRSAIAVESYRGRKIAKHLTTAYRIEILAEETAVDARVSSESCSFDSIDSLLPLEAYGSAARSGSGNLRTWLYCMPQAGLGDRREPRPAVALPTCHHHEPSAPGWARA